MLDDYDNNVLEYGTLTFTIWLSRHYQKSYGIPRRFAIAIALYGYRPA